MTALEAKVAQLEKQHQELAEVYNQNTQTYYEGYLILEMRNMMQRYMLEDIAEGKLVITDGKLDDKHYYKLYEARAKEELEKKRAAAEAEGKSNVIWLADSDKSAEEVLADETVDFGGNYGRLYVCPSTPQTSQPSSTYATRHAIRHQAVPPAFAAPAGGLLRWMPTTRPPTFARSAGRSSRRSRSEQPCS